MGNTIKESVLRMYLSHPFPLLSREERHAQLPWEICRYRYLGLDQHMPGARFLDVGCGTGDRSMLPAKHFGVKEFVGIDHSSASLAVAQKNAKVEGFDRFTPMEGDVLNLPFENGSFDIVVSWGVLHHTSDPLRGFQEMARVCRSGGFVGIFLYNKFGHWRHNLQKARVSRLGGESVEKRFEVAHRLYGTKPMEEMSPSEVSYFYDKYCHPHKSDHTLGETLAWFDQHGLDYWGSFPPLRFRDGLAAMQYRASLRDQFPIERARSRVAVELASRLPASNRSPRFTRPNLIHRSFWQAAYAWIGRHGGFSQGAALSARKR